MVRLTLTDVILFESLICLYWVRGRRHAILNPEGVGFIVLEAALSPGTVVYVPCHQPLASATAPIPFAQLPGEPQPLDKKTLNLQLLLSLSPPQAVHCRIRTYRCSFCFNQSNPLQHPRLLRLKLDLLEVKAEMFPIWCFPSDLRVFWSTQIYMEISVRRCCGNWNTLMHYWPGYSFHTYKVVVHQSGFFGTYSDSKFEMALRSS